MRKGERRDKKPDEWRDVKKEKEKRGTLQRQNMRGGSDGNVLRITH